MASERAILTVKFTAAARAEWLAIWHWNAGEYGERRADAYILFLEKELEKIARSPRLGTDVPEYPGLLRRLAKRRSRGHGHIIFYRVTGSTLEIVHIFHTAQDWQSRIVDAG